MARPAVHALTLYRGDSYTWIFRFWNDAEKTDPTDFTDCTAAAELRDRVGGENSIVQMVATIDGNEITVAFPSAAWVDWSSGSHGVWDLQVSYLGDEVVTYVAGPVEIGGDVVDSVSLGGVGALSRVN
jgi:hypothetical protein